MTPEATTAPVLDPCTEARRLRAEGATLEAIGDHLGVVSSTVYRWTQGIEVTVRRRCRTCRKRFTASRSTRQSVCDSCTRARAERVAAAKVAADERRATREAEAAARRAAREAQQAALAERREAERRAKFCDDCGDPLWTPGVGVLCGWCDPEWDAAAVLAAIDAEARRRDPDNEERAADTARSTTHGGKP